MQIEIQSGFNSTDKEIFRQFFLNIEEQFRNVTETNSILFDQAISQLRSIKVNPGIQVQKVLKEFSPQNLLSSMLTLAAIKPKLVNEYPKTNVSKLRTLEQKSVKNKYHKQTLDLISITSKQSREINSNIEKMNAKIEQNKTKYRQQFLSDFTQVRSDMRLIFQKVQDVEFQLINQFQQKQEKEFAEYEQELVEARVRQTVEIQSKNDLVQQLEEQKQALDVQLKQAILEYEEQLKIVQQLRVENQKIVDLENEIKQLNSLNAVKVQENEDLLQKFTVSENLNEEQKSQIQDLLKNIQDLNEQINAEVQKQENTSREKSDLIKSIKEKEIQIQNIQLRLDNLINVNAQLKDRIAAQEIDRLDELRNLEGDLEQSRLQLSKLETNKNLTEDELNRQKQALQEQLDEQNRVAADLREEINILKGTIDVQEQDDQARQEIIETLENEKFQLKEELQMQRQLLVDEQNNNFTQNMIRQQKHNQVLEELQNQIKQMQIQFQDKEDLIQVLQNKIENQSVEIQSLTQQATELQARLATLQLQVQTSQVQERQSQQRIQQLYEVIELVKTYIVEDDFIRRQQIRDQIQFYNPGNDFQQFFETVENQFNSVNENEVAQQQFKNEIRLLQEQIETQEILYRASQYTLMQYRQTQDLYNQLIQDISNLTQQLNQDKQEQLQLNLVQNQPINDSSVLILQRNINQLKDKIRFEIQQEFQISLDDLRNELEAINVERRALLEQIESTNAQVAEARLVADQNAQLEQQRLQEQLDELKIQQMRYLRGEDVEGIRGVIREKVKRLLKEKPRVVEQIVQGMNLQNQTNARYRNISQNILRKINIETIPTFIDQIVPSLLKLTPLSSKRLINSIYYFLFRKRKPQIFDNQPSDLLQQEEVENLKYEVQDEQLRSDRMKILQSSQNMGLEDELRKKMFGRQDMMGPLQNFDQQQLDEIDDQLLPGLLDKTNEDDINRILDIGLNRIFDEEQPGQPVLDQIQESDDEQIEEQLFNVRPQDEEGGEPDEPDEPGGAMPAPKKKRKSGAQKRKKKRRQQYQEDDGGGDDNPEDGDMIDEDDEGYLKNAPEFQLKLGPDGGGGGDEPPGGDMTEILFSDEEEKKEDDYARQIDLEIQRLLDQIEGNDPSFPGGGPGGSGGRSFSNAFIQSWERSISDEKIGPLELETVLKVLIQMYKKDKKDQQKKAAIPVLQFMLKSVRSDIRSDSQKTRAQFDDVRLISKAI